MYTTALTTFLLTALALAAPAPAPASGLVARGEVHSGVRFSPISNYGDKLNPVQKIETYGACATVGAPPEYKMSDAAGDMKVALDANVPNFFSYCNKRIRLTNPDGRTAEATIVDMCPGCGGDGGPYSLDLLEGPWMQVGGPTFADNVYGASWEVIG
ncbi:hypothetical protein K458DRAFT_21420 [Lentithecium fluviatile CBS 122367]|uniref:RlpA-like protein double-psi beta-barrel domain-containing protein n=1 Tax=Lentithecium fluviatile CBS 122367 TaxID=1168545 RepID=A0A6G1J3W3_9PLEO|nr:hypothetical protein K458DRAFT_21420 [Lentithecium fluviatile CBS 122367]